MKSFLRGQDFAMKFRIPIAQAVGTDRLNPGKELLLNGPASFRENDEHSLRCFNLRMLSEVMRDVAEMLVFRENVRNDSRK